MASDAQLQQLAQSECNVPAAHAAEVQGNVALWWELHAGKGQTLAYLHLKKQILMLLRSKFRVEVDTTIGPDSVKASQKFKHTGDQLADVEREIEKAERGGSSVGRLRVAAPAPSLPSVAEEPFYGGTQWNPKS